MTSELYNNGPIKSAATPVFGTAGLFRAARANKYGATTKPRQNNTPTHRDATTRAEAARSAPLLERALRRADGEF